jgi:hypothetical protein
MESGIKLTPNNLFAFFVISSNLARLEHVFFHALSKFIKVQLYENIDAKSTRSPSGATCLPIEKTQFKWRDMYVYTWTVSVG